MWLLEMSPSLITTPPHPKAEYIPCSYVKLEFFGCKALEIKKITLKGKIVSLVPLLESHVPDLTIAGQNKDIWRYLPYGEINSEDAMGNLVRLWLKNANAGTDLPFTIINNRSGKPIGCTRYLEIDPKNRKLEIGGTWLALAYQRTLVNTECKYLLLKYAFESLGCIRVQFKTDALNYRSQKALERIGAVKEGTLRNHMVVFDGRVRDSIYYSIISSEWPVVKENLVAKLDDQE